MLRKFIKFVLSLALLAGIVYAGYLLHLHRWFGPRVWPYPRQVPINLLEFVNNDGIAWAKNPGDGNFDSPDHPADIPGSSYPADLLPDTGAVFTCASLPGVGFLFPNKTDKTLNNVACSGQRIEVPAAFYDKLFILGSAENGRREDFLTLRYEDKAEVTAPLKFSDWCEPPAFGELTAFAFDFRYTWDDKAKKAEQDPTPTRLWIQEVGLDPKRKLTDITLPANSRMHIFCMTLAAHGYQYPCATYAEDTAQSYASILTEEAALFTALKADIETQKARLERLRTQGDGRFLRESRWVEMEIQKVEGKMPPSPYAGARGRWRGMRAELDAATLLVDSLVEGKSPYAEKRGAILKSFLSEVDGTLQPYSVNVPADYNGAKPYPLVVSLHGHGWYAPFQGHPAPAFPGAIVLSPHGRGSIDYFFIAENDVLTAIHEVQRDYNIDPDRIYLTGHSMGGTGSWHLGVHFPDHFAAIAPNAGNADHKVWRREWGWQGEPEPAPDIGGFFAAIGSVFVPNSSAPKRLGIKTTGDLERYVADACDPVSYAENLCNLPVYCIHGAEDEVVPVGHARSTTSRLKALGYAVQYVELPNAGHGGFPAAETKKQRDWLMKQVRKPKPAFVRFRTNKLRYPGAYWVRLDGFISPIPFAEIEARVLDVKGPTGKVVKKAIEIVTRNTQAFSLDLTRCPVNPKDKLPIKVDGKLAFEGAPPSLGQLHFVLGTGGAWATGDRPSGTVKRAGLEGPVEDAFMSPFLVVYGTASNTAFRRWVVKSEADRFCADWKRMYVNPPRTKPDTELSDEDSKDYNLVLYGGPDENTVTAQLMRHLPIQIMGDKVRFGGEVISGENIGVKFCYPNPWNPERYVVILAGTTWQSLFQISNRFGNWFNWGVYDNRSWADFMIFDDRTISTDTFVAVGFFDTRWKLDPRFIWRGDAKKRAQALPRVVAESAQPPAKDTILYLSQLLPAVIDQHKGPVNLDRSFEGRTIHIGGKAYPRGMGVRAPSAVEFDIGGKFDSLDLVAGIDLEGREKGTPARTKFESVQFSVYGDGKRLYQSDFLQWFSKPAVAHVKITGVKKLRLVTDAGGARWHLGSAAWGELRLTKPPKP